MSNYLLFLLLGLGAGAIYAMLGLGIVMIYRGSGIINFSQGAIAMWIAYVFATLRTSGHYVLPLPEISPIQLTSGPMSTAPSLVIAILTAALLGLFLYVAIFRWLRHAPPLAGVIATVGVMLTLQAVVVLQFGSNIVGAPSVLPSDALHFLGVIMPRDRLYLLGITVALGCALAALYRFTRFGIVTRAAAENEKGASMLGYSPMQIGAANWALGSIVAGLGGILVAPITGLNPITLIYLVIPALAAALIGRFTSLTATIASGVLIGMLESLVLKLKVDFSWIPRENVSRVIPLIAIIGALYFFGDRLPTRASIGPLRLPRATQPRAPVRFTAALVTVLVPLAFVLPSPYRLALILSMIGAVLSLSFVVLTGYLGQVSLATMTLAGISGFLLSHLSTSWGVPFPFDAIIASLVAAVVGAITAFPALRIRGVSLAVVTLSAAVAAQDWLFQNPSFVGGLVGANIRPPSLFGWHFGIQDGDEYPNPIFVLFVVLVLVVALLGVAKLRLSNAGRKMLAIRSNERAAAAIGIKITQVKVFAFFVSALLAGVAGTLIGFEVGSLSIASFDVFVCIAVLGLTYLGGISTVEGALVGGLLAAGGVGFVLTERGLGLSPAYEPLIGGVALIVMVIAQPDGAVEAMRMQAALIKNMARRPGWLADKAAAGAPSADADAAPESTQSLLVSFPSGRRPSASSSEPLLEVKGLSVSYGSVHAVRDMNLVVQPGQLVGLIGPNGAGKTSLVDAVSGFAAHRGTVRLAGVDLAGKAPHQRAAAGMTRTFQTNDVFDDLLVIENVQVGERREQQRRGAADVARDLLRMFDLSEHERHWPTELSNGQRRRLGVARALRQSPALLILDEPAAGLDSKESDELGGRLREILELGIGVLLIDHDMDLVFERCDYVYVMNYGALLAEGPVESIRGDERVMEAYLGSGKHGRTQLAAG